MDYIFKISEEVTEPQTLEKQQPKVQLSVYMRLLKSGNYITQAQAAQQINFSPRQ